VTPKELVERPAIATLRCRDERTIVERRSHVVDVSAR
jgi:hypothetical protein